VASIEDALRLVKADPVVGYVSIPIVASEAPRPAVIIELKGQTIRLPDWNGSEWSWYGNLALDIANRQEVNNESGERDKSRARSNFRAIHPAMVALGSVKPTLEQVGDYYTRAVKLVIASNAATTGPTAGEMAAQAFGAALVEAPATIVAAVKDVLLTATDLFLRDLPKAATKILKDLFGTVAGGVFSGLGSLGPIILIGIGLYIWNESRSQHGEA